MNAHPRARSAAIMALLFVAIAVTSYVLLRNQDRPATIRFEPVLRARASTEAVDAPASAVLDGRSNADLGASWRTMPDDSSPWIEVWSAAPLPVRALAVRLTSGDPASLRLETEAKTSIRPIEVGERDAVFLLDPERQTARWRLRGASSVSRIEPLIGANPVIVVDRDGHGDALLEILRGYGIPAAWMPALPKQMREWLPKDAWVALPSAPAPSPFVGALLDFVRAGGQVFESSSSSPVCAAPSPRTDAASGARLVGPWFEEEIAYPEALTKESPCEDCSERQVLLQSTAGMPALVLHRMGEGRCLRFQGDLVQGVRRMRQGNPALADRDTNAREGIQPSDLFVGQLRPADSSRPHADLLVESVLAALELPFRLHPLPAHAPGLTIFTADQDYVPEAGVDAQLEDGAPEALTLLLTDARFGGKPDVDFGPEHPPTLSATWAAERATDQVELGVHPNLLGVPEDAFASVLADQAAAFEQHYGEAAETVRNHHLRWQGYTEMAEHQAKAGFALNLDYMSLAFRGEGKLGYLNGSGFALRFMREDGTVLPIWQQGTQIDDHVLLPPRFGYESMSVDEMIAVTQDFVDRSLSDPPHPITVNHHPAWRFETDGQWQRALLEASHSRGVPVWNAGRWLRHQRALRDTQIAVLGPRKLNAMTGGAGVALLLPGSVEVRADGERTEASRLRIAGQVWTRIELPQSKEVLIEWMQ